MEQKHLICPECCTRLQRKDVRPNWFCCPGCGVNLRITEDWVIKRCWMGFGAALLLLLMIRPGIWVSLLLLFPLTLLIGIFLFIASAAVAPPKLESDVPHGPPPGSIGLLRK
jgi:hypothetical protein